MTLRRQARVQPRTGAASLEADARGLLERLGVAGELPLPETDRRAANRLVLLGYAARVRRERIRITVTGLEKLGKKAS